MNLHAVVSRAIGAVNPNLKIRVKVNTGSTTSADGTRVPSYNDPVDVIAQVQPLTGKDLRQLEGLNLNGTLKALYLNGEIEGVDRSQVKGGDLVQLPDCTVWLVSQQLEAFNLSAGWTKVAIVQQNDDTF